MADRTLLDTNVLVYALYKESEHHAASRALLTRAEAADAGGACVAAQSLSEFYAVVTNPRRVNPARNYLSALEGIETILSRPGITLLHTPPDLVSRWMGLIRQQPVTAQRVFDVQLVAAMLGNGVRRIVTFNVNDFLPFPDIEVIRP